MGTAPKLLVRIVIIRLSYAQGQLYLYTKLE
jgi:hypothetical protein